MKSTSPSTQTLLPIDEMALAQRTMQLQRLAESQQRIIKQLAARLKAVMEEQGAKQTSCSDSEEESGRLQPSVCEAEPEPELSLSTKYPVVQSEVALHPSHTYLVKAPNGSFLVERARKMPPRTIPTLLMRVPLRVFEEGRVAMELRMDSTGNISVTQKPVS